MTRQIRLNRWLVSNAGIINGRSVEIGPLGPGVNVVSGVNESGKSTMVRALRAALFERTTFRGQSVSSLVSRGTKNAPRVEVDFEVDGTLYRLRKQL
ncbi:MAG: AAA family ATPase [Deltaproteobacteria bacterium]|nr:AAA family ATPase [Deltaproteobacteria bacterium]